MDDKPFGSYIFSFFRPFIFSFKNENFPTQENDDQRTERSEYEQPSETPELSPRDSLLKPDPSKKQFVSPYHKKDQGKNPYFGDDFDSFESEDFDMFRPDNFFGGSSHSFEEDGFHSLFRMMEEMFEKSRQFHFGTFGSSEFDMPNVPNLPSIGPKSFDEGEKIDKDLDGSSGKEIASLLKESPSYQPKPGTDSSIVSPSVIPPSGTSKFKSTSIIRVRRPDGVIEETRKYRDSDGREETEVITREPGSADNASQPIEPFSDPSFSGIFKRFPFSIF